MAIEDPKQRVDYLKRFQSAMRNTKSAGALSSWFDNVRADLSAISNAEVRAEAQRLFRFVESCSYILQRDPDLFPKHFQQSLDDLIDYLDKNDR